MIRQFFHHSVARSSMIRSVSIRAAREEVADPGNFVVWLPHMQLVEIEKVIIPAKKGGQMTIFPGHASDFVALKPGVLTLVSKGKTADYFISCGSVFIHKRPLIEVLFTKGPLVPIKVDNKSNKIQTSLPDRIIADWAKKNVRGNPEVEHFLY